MNFRDRADAGEQLAEALSGYGLPAHAAVYALPRGGVCVGAAVAARLELPLEVVILCKIGHPNYAGHAIAAITRTGAIIAHPAELLSLDDDWLRAAIGREKRESDRRRALYTDGHPSIAANGKTAIIVDDGATTGLSLLAAIHEVRNEQPAQIIVAVPVAPSPIVRSLKAEADIVLALEAPANFFGSVSDYYDTFKPVKDADAVQLLRRIHGISSRRDAAEP